MVNTTSHLTPGTTVEVPSNLGEFLHTLFQAFEQEQVRFCVLYGWVQLQDELETSSELHLALHPVDAGKLPSVYRALSERGYLPIQRWNYAAYACSVVFAWFENLALKTVTLDFVFKKREGSFIWIPGDALATGRKSLKGLWIAEPTTELAHLLVRKVSQGSVTEKEEQHLQVLVEKLGRLQAESVAEEIFGKKRAAQVVDACQRASLGQALNKLRPALSRKWLLRTPFHAIRCVFGDAWRRVQRWRKPTGLSLILLGPDGVGKSTLMAGLLKVFSAAFSCYEIFHWRPGVIVPIRDSDVSPSNPHEEPPRGTLMSVLYLLGFFADFWAGYVVRVRPLLGRSGLVVFDRYFHDLLVDQKRYRYAGPMQFARMLLRFAPGHNGLLLVLDAPEEVILTRKQQLSAEELRRQRAEYREMSRNLPNAHLVETHNGIEPTLAAASQILVRHLAQRLLGEQAPSAFLTSQQVPVDSL